VVADVRCQPLGDARFALESSGLSVGEITTNPAGQPFDDTWIVQSQNPFPNEQVPPGTSVLLRVVDPSTACP
jgi:hypothetical protein